MHLDSLGVEWDDTVLVQCEIGLQNHPHAFAKDAITRDAAKRLAVKMTATTGNEIYLIGGGGDLLAQQNNSLVDEMEGVSLDNSFAKGRRWFSN
ncbi:MAG: hypothetical protein Q9183_005196, partial [Haloplaca sp. 2 TL-2023]